MADKASVDALSEELRRELENPYVETEAAEIWRPDERGPFVWTCEHASRRLVDVEADDDDAELLADHWGSDIGAGDLVRRLSELTSSPAVLSRFSRLVIDPNRDLTEPDLIVEQTLDGPVSFNQIVSADERQARIDSLWAGYHRAVDVTVERRVAKGPVHLISVHSFTPSFAGAHRPMHVGVLYDEHEAWAQKAAEALAAEKFEVALNEPYTGKSGLIYSVARHGRFYEVPFLELEVRNDLIRSRAQIDDVAVRIRRAMQVFEPTV